MGKQNSNGERLLGLHHLHLGLYARVGKKLGVSPSYVSRVANGHRESSRVSAALLGELRKLARAACDAADAIR